MIIVKSSPYLIAAGAIISLLIFLSLRRNGDSTRPGTLLSTTTIKNYDSAASRRKKIDTTSEVGRVSNATLGFEKVFVLGLQERSDKRDSMVLAASLTGFQLEFIDGMRGDQFSDKARPPGLNLQGGAIGSWRTHMNAIRSIVENKYASAFILEDDVDWDIRLLSQLPEFAKGVRSLSDISPTERQHSPYGDDWDVLWPGHCGDVLPENDDRRYVINNDETVPPKAHMDWKGGLGDYPEKTRIVHKAGAPICTFGYAVSYRGAEKILMAVGVKGGANLAIDNSLAFLCRDGYLDMKCYSVEPQLFQHHRPAGPVNKESDIVNIDATNVREKGVTDFIVLSARLNMEKIIMGSEDYVTQW